MECVTPCRARGRVQLGAYAPANDARLGRIRERQEEEGRGGSKGEEGEEARSLDNFQYFQFCPVSVIHSEGPRAYLEVTCRYTVIVITHCQHYGTQ